MIMLSDLTKRVGAVAMSGVLVAAFAPCVPAASAEVSEVAQARTAADVTLTPEQEGAETELLALALIYWKNGSDVSKFSAEQKANVLKYAKVLGSDYFAREDLEDETAADAAGSGNLFAKMYIEVLADSLSSAQSDLASAKKSLEAAKKEAAAAEKRASAAEKTSLKYLKISKLTATPGMAKATLKWVASDSIAGVKYRVEYQVAGSSMWKAKTVSKLKATVKLKAKKKYQFRVCGVVGKTKSDYSTTVTATTLPSYKKGTFKVSNAGGVIVRSKASVSGSTLAALKKGAKVKVVKFKTDADGGVWGKLKKKYGGKTGYVRMDNMKKA